MLGQLGGEIDQLGRQLVDRRIDARRRAAHELAHPFVPDAEMGAEVVLRDERTEAENGVLEHGSVAYVPGRRQGTFEVTQSRVLLDARRAAGRRRREPRVGSWAGEVADRPADRPAVSSEHGGQIVEGRGDGGWRNHCDRVVPRRHQGSEQGDGRLDGPTRRPGHVADGACSRVPSVGERATAASGSRP